MCCVIAEGLIWQGKTCTETMRVFLVAIEQPSRKSSSVFDRQSTLNSFYVYNWFGGEISSSCYDVLSVLFDHIRIIKP